MKQNVDYEQLISFHPTFKSLGDQPALRDMVFDYYCGLYQNTDKATLAVKKYLDEVHEVFCNQRKS